MTGSVNRQYALSDPERFVFLYGATPPRADAPPERIQRAASRLSERTKPLALDAIVVYDVQDESDRTSEPRPFPFLPTVASRVYSQLINTLTDRPVITYKCVAGMSEQDWRAWLDEAGSDYSVRYLSIVGAATSQKAHSGVALSRAIQIASSHPYRFTLGGVVIPERHRAPHSESERLIRKASSGCDYFISQAVYHPEMTIRLLQDYHRDCAERGLSPKRIVLTFTPCGRPQTLAFMKWLGITMTPETEHRILSSPSPLTESISICSANLRRILETGCSRLLPLGINVESVSIAKEEIGATIDLYYALREVIDRYCPNPGQTP